MTETESQLADFLKGQGSEVIGAVVMWALSSVRVKRDDLRAELEAIDLGKAMPKDPRPERLLGKAIEMSRSGAKGFLFRKLAKREWALVQERELEDGTLELLHTITIGVEKDEDRDRMVPIARDLEGAEPSAGAYELADAVIINYAEAEDFANTDDLSIVLTQAMGGTDVNPMLGALSLRQGSGGVYFVPGAQVERVRALQRLVGEQGDSHMTVLTMYGDAANLEEAAAAARSSFTAKLNELRAELLEFVETMKEDGKAMTDSHMQTRVRRLHALQERVDMWGDALGAVHADLVEGIGAAKTEVGKAMGLV
jgi:hypothetical protein